MPKFQRAIHLRFHFAGTNTTPDDTYDHKIYVRSNWTPPHWTLPPVEMKERLDNSQLHLVNYSKNEWEKQASYHIRHVIYNSCNDNKTSLSAHAIKPRAGNYQTR